MQEFLTRSPWEAGEVMRQIQADFAREFAPSTSQWPLGTVGVLDETSVEKSGPDSCGAAPQYCGRLAKTANCQVGVFLLGVAPAGAALVAHLESLGISARVSGAGGSTGWPEATGYSQVVVRRSDLERAIAAAHEVGVTLSRHGDVERPD
jgi:hypothetical protein